MKRDIEFKLNGALVSLNADDDRILLWTLRTDLALTGTKYGCGEGICGACTVVINGTAHRSCRVALKEVIGADVKTIEGLAGKDQLHPLQQAFIDYGGFQCGYCTSGMLLDAYVLLSDEPHPSRGTIIAHMDHNLCRCGAYQRIVDAIEHVSAQTEGQL